MINESSNKLTVRSIFIALVVAFATFAGSYGQFQLPPLQTLVMANAGLSESQYVSAFSAPMLPGLLLSLVAGVLIDRYGFRKMIFLALVITFVGALGRSFCHSYALFWIAMAFTGVAPTFVQSNNAKIMSSYVPADKISFAIGIVMLGGASASFFGSATTHLFPGTTSAYVFSGILVAVAIALWLGCIHEKKSPAAAEGGVPAETKVSVGEALRAVIRSGKVWRVGLCMFFVESCFMSVSSTAPNALMELGYQPGTAGLLAGILSVGSPLGGLIGAPLAIRTGRPKLCMMVLAGLTVIVFPLLWSAESVVLCAFAFFLLGFCFGTCLITSNSLPIRFPEIGQRYAGTAGGLINTILMAGGFFIPSFIITPLSGGDYHKQFLICTAALGVGFLLMFLIPSIREKEN